MSDPVSDAKARARDIVTSQGGSHAQHPWDETQHPRKPAGSERGGEFAAKDESDQDISYREWQENADRVAADPAKASVKDLNRAAGYLSHKREFLRIRAQKEGRIVNRDLMVSIQNEIDWYSQLIKERTP
jgi:hypothetical protein